MNFKCYVVYLAKSYSLFFYPTNDFGDSEWFPEVNVLWHCLRAVLLMSLCGWNTGWEVTWGMIRFGRLYTVYLNPLFGGSCLFGAITSSKQEEMICSCAAWTEPTTVMPALKSIKDTFIECVLW